MWGGNLIYVNNDGNYSSIPPTLDGWVYIAPIHGLLDGPLYTWAQYTPTIEKGKIKSNLQCSEHVSLSFLLFLVFLLFLFLS
jgi:hypothetical protein